MCECPMGLYMADLKCQGGLPFSDAPDTGIQWPHVSVLTATGNVRLFVSDKKLIVYSNIFWDNRICLCSYYSHIYSCPHTYCPIYIHSCISINIYFQIFIHILIHASQYTYLTIYIDSCIPRIHSYIYIFTYSFICSHVSVCQRESVTKMIIMLGWAICKKSLACLNSLPVNNDLRYISKY